MTRTTTVEPPGCPAQLRAICCDTLGFVKVVQSRVENGAECGPLDVVARWGQPGSGLGITAISYSTGLKNKLAVARKSGMIEVLDSANGAVCAQLAAPPVEKVRGEGGEICRVHLFKDNSSWENRILSCRQNGNAVVQSFNDKEIEVVKQWDVCKSGKILSMKVHNNEKFAAFGGEGVELNLWDLEGSSKVWEAKKPKRDKIGLVAPAFVTASTFLAKDDHRKVVIGTGDYQVRLYDVKAQRRPVIAVDYGESPIKAVAEDPDGYTVYVGNAAGNMASFDMRTGKLVAGFKGKLTGSVRCIARHSVLPVIASCGLDRFLRVHDISSRQLLGKIFLKQPLVGVVFDDVTTKETNDGILVDKSSVEQYEDMSEHEEDKKRATPKRKHSDDKDEDPEEYSSESPKKKKKVVISKRKHEDGDPEEEYSSESPKKKKKVATSKRKHEDGDPEEEYSSESPKKKKKVVTSKRKHKGAEIEHEDVEVPKKKNNNKVKSKSGDCRNSDHEERKVPKKEKVKSKQKHEEDHNVGDGEECKDELPKKKKKVEPKEKQKEEGETHNNEHDDIEVPEKKKDKSKTREKLKKVPMKSKREKQAGNKEESPKIKQRNR